MHLFQWIYWQRKISKLFEISQQNFKKGASTSKNSYRPVNILPVGSKILEKLIHDHFLVLFVIILQKFQCSLSNRLLHGKLIINDACVLERCHWQKRVLLIDLSKALYRLCHDLLVAKLHAYRLNISSLNFLQDYLSNCKQRTKVDSFFSSWENNVCGVLQGSTQS